MSPSWVLCGHRMHSLLPQAAIQAGCKLLCLPENVAFLGMSFTEVRASICQHMARQTAKSAACCTAGACRGVSLEGWRAGMPAQRQVCAHAALPAVAPAATYLECPIPSRGTNPCPTGTPIPQSLELAEPLDGPLMRRFCQLAADTGLWLSVGGFQERGPDPQHLHNCHVVISSAGQIVQSYRRAT